MAVVNEAAKRDALKRLIHWAEGDKYHSVKIDRGSGFGATCWTVVLAGRPFREQTEYEKNHENWEVRHRNQRVYAAETNFWEIDRPLEPNEVYVVDADELEDWPGLEATIHAALDRAEELGL